MTFSFLALLAASLSIEWQYYKPRTCRTAVTIHNFFHWNGQRHWPLVEWYTHKNMNSRIECVWERKGDVFDSKWREWHRTTATTTTTTQQQKSNMENLVGWELKTKKKAKKEADSGRRMNLWVLCCMLMAMIKSPFKCCEYIVYCITNIVGLQLCSVIFFFCDRNEYK